MWPILNGTIVNVLTVAVGGVLGLAVGGNLHERYRSIILQCLGLVTITLGIDAAVLQFADLVARNREWVRDAPTYGARLAMVMVGSLLAGSLIGTWLQIHERIDKLGAWIHARFAGPGSDAGKRFAEGFLTASVIFCVGPLTLLGCLENGAHANPRLLYIKAFLDGFCAIALSASLGIGVLASILTIVGFQGSLAILAWKVGDPLHPVNLGLMTVVGGVALLGTALMILDLKKVPVANMLPGIFLPPLFVWIAERFWPGLILPIAIPGS